MMKWTKIMAFIMCILAGTTLNANSDSGLKHYNKGEYKLAIEAYEQLIKTEGESAILHYNLGNAYFKNNELGQAILHFEIANKMEPGNSDILHNLEFARNKTIDKIEVRENFLFNALQSSFTSLFSATVWAWISILSLCIIVISVLVILLASVKKWKMLCFNTAIIGLVLIVVSLFAGSVQKKNLIRKDSAVILVTEVSVKADPNEQSKTLFNLHEGTKVAAIEVQEDFYLVRLENGNEGFVKAKDIGLF